MPVYTKGVSDARFVGPAQAQRGAQAIAADALTVAVVFGAAFAAAPGFVRASVRAPADGAAIFATLIADTLTAAGCTFSLSGPPPAAGYSLQWRALA